jgi:hypothetical protein
MLISLQLFTFSTKNPGDEGWVRTFGVGVLALVVEEEDVAVDLRHRPGKVFVFAGEHAHERVDPEILVLVVFRAGRAATAVADRAVDLLDRRAPLRAVLRENEQLALVRVVSQHDSDLPVDQLNEVVRLVLGERVLALARAAVVAGVLL